MRRAAAATGQLRLTRAEPNIRSARLRQRLSCHRTGAPMSSQSSAPPSKAYDVVIVGGGVIGCSAAYHLAVALGEGSGVRIAVIERDSSYKHASSALSAAGIRQQFSLHENIQMSMYGASFLRSSKEVLGVDVGLKERGYLFIADGQRGHDALTRRQDAQRAAGASWIQVLDSSGLRERYGWGQWGEGSHGATGTHSEGWFDPWALLQGLRSRARECGVDLLSGHVTSLHTTPLNQDKDTQHTTPLNQDKKDAQHTTTKSQDDKDTHHITGLTYQDKDGHDQHVCVRLALVNAAGAWASSLITMAQPPSPSPSPAPLCPLPVIPRRRVVFVVHCADASAPPESNTPLVIEPNGVYWRPEGHTSGRYICGVSPSASADPDFAPPPPSAPLSSHTQWLESTLGPATEEDYANMWEDLIWPTMAQRVPAFQALKVVGSWSGYYDYNTLDQNAILGPHPHLPNMILANGFSGHGLQQSPAAGRFVCEEILQMLEDRKPMTDRRTIPRSLDLSRFSPRRLLTSTPIFEDNIV